MEPPSSRLLIESFKKTGSTENNKKLKKTKNTKARMVNNMEKLRNTINTILGWACVFVFAVMVVVGTYQIVVRYFFNNPSTVSEELLTYSFTWMALLSTALVFGKRDHMRMGFLADKVTGQKKKVLEIGIELLIILFALVVMVYGGISIMKLTMTQITASLGVSMGLIYTIIPLSGILIVIYGIMNIIDLAKGKGE